MQRKTLVLSFALMLSLPLQGQSSSAELRVKAVNPGAIVRPGETLSLQWNDVTARLQWSTPAQVRVLDAEGNEIVSQVIDSDGNGTPDELLWQADFAARQTRTFTVRKEAPVNKVVSRVFVRHDDPRDDIAWESDRIAFRIYGEGLKKTSSAMSSSGIDVWPKRVRALIVEKWYAKGHDAYHIDTGEGADFYDVGETLGTGGTAIWVGESIYRADNFKAYRIIANGPVRAVFELTYAPWRAGPWTVSETKRFSIDAGHNLYRQESIFQSGQTVTIPYAIGLVKRPGMRGTATREREWAWLTGWGPVAPKNGGHGELGTAVLLPRARLTDWKETGNHYLAITRAMSGEKVVHYIGAGWTASGDFPTPQSWWAYLDNMADRLASPIVLTVN